ncbi:hypothetical protein OIU77_013283 [Salix suchowensis]|uniref:Uncharacterized protein n=1 Tax=Salix suchowensis TaxID=1278906 RepID=A0ABQ8ZTB6_9ROSI|nr:hypothetical protein OIU77_013283 [Salix suchowensis]
MLLKANGSSSLEDPEKRKTIKICRYLLMRSSIFPAFLVDSEMIQTRLQICLQYAEDI